MQQKSSTYFLFVILSAAISCSKKIDKPAGTASLTIINAVVGSGALISDFNSAYTPGFNYIQANSIQYNTFVPLNNQLNAYSGMQRVALYRSPDTLSTSKPFFDLLINLPIGSISSLFLTGTVDAPDTLLITDTPPYHPGFDSISGIRFVNLSPGSAPISINIEGQANGSEINSLPYKGITEFKNYITTASTLNYTFEFRDMATGTLLATYTLVAAPYKNHTVAFLGIPNGTGDKAQTVLRIDNYLH